MSNESDSAPASLCVIAVVDAGGRDGGSRRGRIRGGGMLRDGICEQGGGKRWMGEDRGDERRRDYGRHVIFSCRSYLERRVFFYAAGKTAQISRFFAFCF